MSSSPTDPRSSQRTTIKRRTRTTAAATTSASSETSSNSTAKRRAHRNREHEPRAALSCATQERSLESESEGESSGGEAGGTCCRAASASSSSEKVSEKLEALKNLIPATRNGDEVVADELFQETAEYILRLRTQVVILQALVRLYGSDDSLHQISEKHRSANSVL